MYGEDEWNKQILLMNILSYYHDIIIIKIFFIEANLENMMTSLQVFLEMQVTELMKAISMEMQ